MEKFIRDLNLNKSGHYEKNKYIIQLEDSNEFSRVYTLLDNSNLVWLDTEAVLISEHSTVLVYNDEDLNFNVKLIADYDGENYQIIISENTEEVNDEKE